MIAVTYSGYYKVFAISSNKTVVKIYEQYLLNVVSNGGVYCAETDAENRFLVVGSFASNSSGGGLGSYSSSKKQLSSGLYLWRVLNAEPWLKHEPMQKSDYDSSRAKVN